MSANNFYWSDSGEWIGIDFGIEIPDDFPVIVTKPLNGCYCQKCKEFFPYAVSNQPDGNFKCWGCRQWE